MVDSAARAPKRISNPYPAPPGTLAIREEAPRITSMFELWRVSLHFSSSCTLEASHGEQVWLAVGNPIPRQSERTKDRSCPQRWGNRSTSGSNFPRLGPFPHSSSIMTQVPALRSPETRSQTLTVPLSVLTLSPELISGHFCLVCGICHLTIASWRPPNAHALILSCSHGSMSYYF